MSVYIIAEAGVNHNGKFELAKKMIDVAKIAGVDAIKFQTFKSEKLVSQRAQKAEYQAKETGSEETQLDMLKKLELSYEEFTQLAEYCKEVGIEFLSTPFDMDSIDFLDDLGINLYKLPSGEITNTPFLIKVAKLGKPIILSTGMSNMKDIELALKTLKDNGARDISLLHCNTQYPTPFEDVNLRAMKTIKDTFGLPTGYSDHTIGNEVSIAAVALGAQIIEKHFTLDKDMEGPDHKASMSSEELIYFVKSIRNVENALGSSEKKLSPSEAQNIVAARKSLVANMAIKKGEIFTELNLAVKRPGNGISPVKWFEVLGTTAKRNFVEDELIEL
ncbi:MAG: N-acetylneuraminate synthase [Clostridiales bacterium]|jgi:N,N'-diacetyllegionaminate synthase|nr:N-acetylneuraminate synthase [Clostridiales bacterium]